MISKQQVFSRYSGNLRKVIPELSDRYICPLTLCVFDESQLEHLTLEHCIPKNLGETLIVLTSKKSNNEAGSKIDVHLHRMLKHTEFFRDCIGEYPVRMNLGRFKVGADFARRITDSGPESKFQISDSRSNRKDVEGSRGEMENGQSPSEFLISLRSNDRYIERRAKLALVKACYLRLFWRLGYSLILHPIFNLVRDQIASPDPDLLPIDGIVHPIEPTDVQEDVFFIIEPAELFAFGVDFRLRKNAAATWTCYRVVMPCSSKSMEGWRASEPRAHGCGKVASNIDYIENPAAWIDYQPANRC